MQARLDIRSSQDVADFAKAADAEFRSAPEREALARWLLAQPPESNGWAAVARLNPPVLSDHQLGILSREFTPERLASPETLQALPGWCQERLAFRGVLSSYQTNWEAAKSWMEALPAAHWSRELCALPRRATPAQTLDWMSLLERQADNEGMAAIRADLFKVSGSNAIRAGDLLGAFDLLSQSQNDPSLQTARLDIIGELVTYDPASVSEWMSQHPLPESERDGIISELCRSVPTEDSGSVDWAVMIQDPQRRSQVLLALFKRGVVPTLAHRKLIESWPTDNPVKQAIVDQKR